jgi:hypothetical protein
MQKHAFLEVHLFLSLGRSLMHESVTMGVEEIYTEITPAAIHASGAKIVDAEVNFHVGSRPYGVWGGRLLGAMGSISRVRGKSTNLTCFIPHIPLDRKIIKEKQNQLWCTWDLEFQSIEKAHTFFL